MIRYAMLALTAALSAAGAAGAVVSIDGALKTAPAAQVQPVDAARIARAHDGHYWAQGQVNGRAVRFLVDTGATAVALTREDAQRLGIDTRQIAYDYEVVTAAGRTRAAAVKLAEVSIGGAQVSDVDALVVEEGLETSLLGMSYLGRLSGFEATPATLVLRG